MAKAKGNKVTTNKVTTNKVTNNKVTNNKVKIDDISETVTRISYIDGSVDVTPGQKNDPPPTISQSGRVFTISFAANHKGNEGVAGRYNGLCGGSAHEYAGRHGGGTPNKLNFYFGVEIRFETAQGGGTLKIYLGQGHGGTANNWWIGGSGISIIGPSVTVAIGDKGKKLILPLSGGVSDFKFGLGSIV
jgi:hypothetical protein